MGRIYTFHKILHPLIGLLLFALLTAACGEATTGIESIAPLEGTYAVHPLFREFYDHLGGRQVLGPAISTLFEYNGQSYQYVQNACLEYDPAAPGSEKFRLSPLGLEMNISEPAVPEPEPGPDGTEHLYINGHVIYKGFVAMYRKMGGTRFVGLPITELHYNPEKKRYEQYFENMGFYWQEGATPENTGLLAYGAWKCAEYCPSSPPQSSIVILPSNSPSAVNDLFTGIVSRVGPTLTGFALTPSFQADDGMQERIYESLVIAVDPQDPTHIVMRPLPEKVGILPGDLVSPNGVEGMVFWPTEGEGGHNVPQVFVDYILLHGGVEVSGEPISELFLVDNQIFRQCFRNYCLDYHLGATTPNGLRIRPAPLGFTYKQLYFHPQETSSFTETQDLHAISLKVWEKHPFVSTKQNQRIGASLFEGNQPLRNVEPLLTLTMPDGSQQSYYFPPTGNDGQTSKRLDPISAPNGTLIPYQVCISSLTGEHFCVKDSFVIWNIE